MPKRRITITAAAGLLAGAALAQPNASPPPEAGPNSAALGTAKVVRQQSKDQLLASKFRGSDVFGPDNQRIGNVSDILFDSSGRIEAYVISVGGFLGVGSKEVALEPDAFELVDDNGTVKVKTSVTKDELQRAANFEPIKPGSKSSPASAGVPGAGR